MRSIHRVLPLVLLFAVASVGCDSATDNVDDTFPLNGERDAIFDYDGVTLNAGEVYMSPPQAQSSAEVINDGRFDPADITMAVVVSSENNPIEISLRSPLNGQITINEATLVLSADGVADQVVARGSDLFLSINGTNTQQRRAELQPVEADVTRFLQQESFTGRLVLDVEGASDDTFDLTVSFGVDAFVVAARPAAPEL